MSRVALEDMSTLGRLDYEMTRRGFEVNRAHAFSGCLGKWFKRSAHTRIFIDLRGDTLHIKISSAISNKFGPMLDFGGRGPIAGVEKHAWIQFADFRASFIDEVLVLAQQLDMVYANFPVPPKLFETFADRKATNWDSTFAEKP